MKNRADIEALLGLILNADETATLAALASPAAQNMVRGVPEILHAVVKRNFLEVAKRLVTLDAGCSVDTVVDGHTALHRAVLAGHVEMTQLLLKAGADPGCRVEGTARQDMTALHLASAGTPALLQAVLAAAPPETVAATTFVITPHDDVLRLVLRDERPEMLAVLHQYGIFFNQRGEDGLTPAQYVLRHRATRAGGLVMLQLLEAGGADLHALTAGGETLLMLAAQGGWVEAFDYLLKAGVATDGVTADGETLLHAAARGPDLALLCRVLRLGIDVNARNRQGETALYRAAHRNRLAHVEALLQAGADPHIADSKGRTPDMVCQSRVQSMTRQALLRAQNNKTPVKERLIPRRKEQNDVRKRRIGPSKRR